MRFPRVSLPMLILTARLAGAAGLSIPDGYLWLNGGSIRTDAFELGGALEGNGIMASPYSRLAGRVSPCGRISSETGALNFDGSVEFAGAYVCTVNGNEDTDRIQATGPVSGTASLTIIQAPDAIPLARPVLEGSPDSIWTGFSLISVQRPLMRLDSPAPGTLTLTDIVGDSDGDGLPDWWEYAFFTNRTLAVPGTDDDGDRSNNLAELGAGTHPLDPDSVFAIVHANADSGHRLIWNSVAGKTYAIHSAESPTSDFILRHSGIPATPPQNAWTHPAPSPASQFYQIRVEP